MIRPMLAVTALAAAVTLAQPAQPTVIAYGWSDMAPLIPCEEDQACWIGSRDDSRTWEQQRAAAPAGGWRVTAHCIALDLHGRTLTRCADHSETLTHTEEI